MRSPSLALLLCLTLSAAAQDEEPLLHEDQSWTHIGDGNFSTDSDAAGDMTYAVAGGDLELKLELDSADLELLKDPGWRCLVFAGEVIGNDVERIPTCEPTQVKLNGKVVGQISQSGMFRILIDRALLSLDPEVPNVFRVESGRNGDADRDDQELGFFTIRLTREPLPKVEEPPTTDDE